MSDTQRQVKMVAEQALANLVERAKRLQLSSVSAFESNANRVAYQTLSESIFNVAAGSPPKKIKGLTGGITDTPKGNFTFTARKPRKLGLEPSPPPPSPRELCMIAELRDEFQETDQLIDQMLNDAASLNRDMINCSQHQRDLSLVQEIELETTTRSLDTIFEALSAECEREDLKQIIYRCGHALERAKERSIFEPNPTPSPTASPTASPTTSPTNFIQNAPDDTICLEMDQCSNAQNDPDDRIYLEMDQCSNAQNDPDDRIYLEMDQYIENELLPLEPLDANLYDLNDLNDLDTFDHLDDLDLIDSIELSSDSNLLSSSQNISDNKLD